MTGPEHYRKAEELLSVLGSAASEHTWLEKVASGELAVAMAGAQAHATLALAAATALYDNDLAKGEDSEAQAWREVAS